MELPGDCESVADYLQQCFVDAEAEVGNLSKIRARFERMRADLVYLAQNDDQRALVNDAVSALVEYFMRGNIVPAKRKEVLAALHRLRDAQHAPQPT